MSHDSKVTKKCGSLSVNGPITIAKSNVTQATSITTAVLASASTGVITTVSSTLAAEGAASFTLNNPKITSSSTVFLSINNYSGNQGLPSVRVNAVSDGSCSVVLSNNHGTSALNGIVKIAYLIM